MITKALQTLWDEQLADRHQTHSLAYQDTFFTENDWQDDGWWNFNMEEDWTWHTIYHQDQSDPHYQDYLRTPRRKRSKLRRLLRDWLRKLTAPGLKLREQHKPFERIVDLAMW